MIGNVIMTTEDGLTSKSAYDDFQLIIAHKVIHAPSPKFRKVEVDGRDGAIDLTEYATGKVRFEERQIDLSFRYLGNENMRTAMVSELLSFVHGKKISYIFNDDLDYIYVGRMSVCDPEVNGVTYDLSTNIIAEPYKRDLQSSAEDWLWDPFDFELGVINEMSDIYVNGTKTVTLIGSSYSDNPILTLSSAMNVSYDGGTAISINSGTHKVYDILITEGEHTFTFTGHGTVTIYYRGGIL